MTDTNFVNLHFNFYYIFYTHEKCKHDKIYIGHCILISTQCNLMRWEEHVACTGERRGVNRVLVGKSEGKGTTLNTQAKMGG